MKIPKPILFNCIKHHMPFIRNELNRIILEEKDPLNYSNELVMKIGNSLMDVYLGNLSPSVISNEIKVFLGNKDKLDKKTFTFWLKENNGYRLVRLTDSSEWTLREGRIESRYVHIHPARYSPHTIRVRASTLKTAIVTYIRAKNTEAEITKETVNEIRTEFLNLPPIKSLPSFSSFGRIIDMLES